MISSTTLRRRSLSPIDQDIRKPENTNKTVRRDSEKMDTYISSETSPTIGFKERLRALMHSSRIEDVFISSHDESYSPNTTLLLPVPSKLEEQLTSLLIVRGSELLEDTVHSDLLEKLTVLINTYGATALDVIRDWIIQDKISSHVANEVIVYIGQLEMEHVRERLMFLERWLINDSPQIRYFAVISLAYLNEPVSIPTIRQALQIEPIPSIRQDMKQLLNQLEIQASRKR